MKKAGLGPMTDGRARCADAAVTFVLLACAAGAWFAGGGPWTPLTNPDSLDFADIGRELFRGHGLATRQLFPRHIPFMAEHGLLDRPYWPLLHRYPLTPLLTAAAMPFTADAPMANVVQCGVCFVVTVALTYRLARRFLPPLAACVPALLVLGDPSTAYLRVSGLTHTAAMALTLAVFLAVQRKCVGRAGWLISGALCGVAYLARTQLLLLLVIPGMAALRPGPWRRRLSAIALTATAALAVAAPWMVRSARLTGNPLFNFSNTRNLVRLPTDGYDIELDLNEPVEAGALLSKHWERVTSRVSDNLRLLVTPKFWTSTFDAGGVGFLLVSLAALFFGPREQRDEWNGLVRSTWLYLALSIAAVSIAIHQQQYYAVFRPLLAIIGCTTVWILAGRAAARWTGGLRKGIAVAGCAAAAWLACRSVVAQQAHVTMFAELDERQRESMAIVRAIVPENGIVLCDAAGWVVLYGERRAVRAPIDPEQIDRIDRTFVRIDYLLLRPQTGAGGDDSRSKAALYQRYAQFIAADEFAQRFRALQSLPNGYVLYGRLRASP